MALGLTFIVRGLNSFNNDLACFFLTNLRFWVLSAWNYWQFSPMNHIYNFLLLNLISVYGATCLIIELVIFVIKCILGGHTCWNGWQIFINFKKKVLKFCIFENWCYFCQLFFTRLTLAPRSSINSRFIFAHLKLNSHSSDVPST